VRIRRNVRVRSGYDFTALGPLQGHQPVRATAMLLFCKAIVAVCGLRAIVLLQGPKGRRTENALVQALPRVGSGGRDGVAAGRKLPNQLFALGNLIC
jgi:hypothetical protein